MIKITLLETSLNDVPTEKQLIERGFAQDLTGKQYIMTIGNKDVCYDLCYGWLPIVTIKSNDSKEFLLNDAMSIIKRLRFDYKYMDIEGTENIEEILVSLKFKNTKEPYVVKSMSSIDNNVAYHRYSDRWRVVSNGIIYFDKLCSLNLN